MRESEKGRDLRIAVLITTFNRVAVTLRGLEAFFAAVAQQDIASFEVFLVDDASPDGTAAKVRAAFPEVHVSLGNGKLWWNGGMVQAYRDALAAPHEYDAYLLYNDDVILKPGALEELVQTFVELNRQGPAALTGSMCTSDEPPRPSYPGLSINPKHNPLRRPFHPRLLMQVPPDGTLKECDTFHANCVLIPASLMLRSGGIDPIFHHRHGDTDLGFRLRRMGCRNFMMPDYVGICELNPPFPVPPSLVGRLMFNLAPPNPIYDDLNMVFRRYPFHIACANSVIRIAYLVRNALWPARAGHPIQQRKPKNPGRSK